MTDVLQKITSFDLQQFFRDDKKRIVIVALFFIFLVSLVLYPLYRGIVLMAAFISFGALSNIGDDHAIKILSLVCLIILSLFNIVLYGVNFGIEFSGGIRIPVILKKPVDSNTMQQIINTFKKRASLMGLTQAKVVAVGPSEVDIEIAKTNDPRILKKIEQVITEQGQYMAVVDGKVAITGDHIIPGTVARLPPQEAHADWGVTFSVDEQGAEQFAKVVKGKANYPCYMFLDRPHNADIFLTPKELDTNALIPLPEAVKAAKDALRLQGDTIGLYLINSTFNATKLNGTGRIAIISKADAPKIEPLLKRAGYNVTIVQNISPVIKSYNGRVQVDTWKAVGLLSAPSLSPGITNGAPSYSYSITGDVQGKGAERAKRADEQAKIIETLLKSGSLPVQITVGNTISIPAPLGKQFLQLSLMGIAISIVAIAIFVSLRYRHPKFVVPIFLISLSELIIMLSILGSFTVDLAAMAGIIAAIGVGVDAQIVITDELLKSKDKQDHKEALKKAFDIITLNVIVAVITMLPLMFSGMVEVISFSLSTILGALLGLLISRPSYATIVEHLL